MWESSIVHQQLCVLNLCELFSSIHECHCWTLYNFSTCVTSPSTTKMVVKWKHKQSYANASVFDMEFVINKCLWWFLNPCQLLRNNWGCEACNSASVLRQTEFYYWCVDFSHLLFLDNIRKQMNTCRPISIQFRSRKHLYSTLSGEFWVTNLNSSASLNFLRSGPRWSILRYI